MKIIPRHYQAEAIRLVSTALRRAHKALAVLATGLGKTITSAFIAQKVKARRVLFLVHNNFILENSVKEYARVFGESRTYALYNGLSKNGAADADFVFASFQTMGGNLSEWSKNHFDLLIVDEGHHAHAETYRPVIEHFTCPRLGLTATPDRGDLQDIREIFGNEVVNITLEEAIARGWLPRIEYHVITDESLDNEALQEIVKEIHESKKRFTMAEVNRRIFIKKRDEEIARIINGYNEKAVVFCASIHHAEGLSKSLNLASTFHSEVGENQQDTWDQNQETLTALKNGTIRRVCAVNAFNEGVDVPSIGLVAFCRATSVPTIFRQQLGRGLRPGKDKLIVLDFVGNLERVQLVLEMMNRISDLHEKFTPKGEMDREGYKRERFEVSGQGFEFTFSDRIVDLMKVLEHCETEFYGTWQEASVATKVLGIRTSLEYKTAYRNDPRLPSFPYRTYGDFPGWPEYLGVKNRNEREEFYTSWKEASAAVKKLGIDSAAQYNKRYKEDCRLPAAPYRIYSDFPGWRVYLGTSFYSKWKEASSAAIALGARSRTQYQRLRKLDSRLPSMPARTYEDWPGWPSFLGVVREPQKTAKDFYDSWQKAAKAVKKLGIRSGREYGERYHCDSGLHSSPDSFYPDFPGWTVFLGGVEKNFYTTWQEASLAAQKLGIKSAAEHFKRYCEDPRLPSAPDRYYGEDFPGWRKFLGKE